MKRIARDKHVFEFSSSLKPVAEVHPGEEVLFETLDSWVGRLKRPEDIHQGPDPRGVNPVTGPVFVHGAEPGDALIAEILTITPHSPAINKITASGGVLHGEISAPHCRFVDIVDGWILLSDGLRIALRPMIGCIGTAPSSGSVPTLDPGDHGGNMDHNDIREGVRVYLPVAVPGALFALGDVHAFMGDGEVSGAGLDCSADVTVRFDLRKGLKVSRPLIETSAEWVTCASAPELQRALKLATGDMVNLLTQRLEISREDAFLLVTAVGDAKIGQACASAIDATARMSFPKLGKLCSW
jgi:amidase